MKIIFNEEIYPVRSRARAEGTSLEDRGAATSNGVYNAMINKENPYGDGKAAEKIILVIKRY